MAWYNPDKLVSYNQIFNFVVGNRGGGKSYNFKRLCINRFLKTGSQFVWVRRYKPEVANIDKFFEDIKEEYPCNEFEFKNKMFYCDGEVMGYVCTLSSSLAFRSTPYPKVTTIVYDEFLINRKSHQQYLRNEVVAFLELFESVARKRDNVSAYLVANNISVVNPYFTYFGLTPNPDQRYNKFMKKGIVVEFFADADFIEEKKNTRFGKALQGTQYGAYAIENKPLLDNDQFVEKKSIDAGHWYNMFYKGQWFGFWLDQRQGELFVSKSVNLNTPRNFCLTRDDLKPNMFLIHNINGNTYIKRTIKMFDLGLVKYESIGIKNQFYEIMALFRR